MFPNRLLESHSVTVLAKHMLTLENPRDTFSIGYVRHASPCRMLKLVCTF